MTRSASFEPTLEQPAHEQDRTRIARLSAVVPTLDEESTVAASLDSLRAGGVDELIVVDGGSRDGTIDIAKGMADVVLRSERGLFAQLNVGAAQASGDGFVFHYADVRFPPNGAAAAISAMERSAGGAFSLAFDSDRRSYRFIARGAALRNRLGVGPFGDQAIFVRRDAFEAVGGFREDGFLADLQLVRAVRRRGGFSILPECVSASTRRWERVGVLRTLADHWWLTALFVCGRRSGETRAARKASALRTIR